MKSSRVYNALNAFQLKQGFYRPHKSLLEHFSVTIMHGKLKLHIK